MLAQVGAAAVAARRHEEMLAYWSSLRQNGRIPGRAQIDPGAFKNHLPHVSLIDVRKDGDYSLRLAGTGLYGVYGREITGRRLEEVYAPEAAAYWRVELERVIEKGRPCVGCHSLSWRGFSKSSLFWIRLPLASDGRRVDMIMGYDAVVGVPDMTSGIRAA